MLISELFHSVNVNIKLSNMFCEVTNGHFGKGNYLKPDLIKNRRHRHRSINHNLVSEEGEMPVMSKHFLIFKCLGNIQTFFVK